MISTQLMYFVLYVVMISIVVYQSKKISKINLQLSNIDNIVSRIELSVQRNSEDIQYINRILSIHSDDVKILTKLLDMQEKKPVEKKRRTKLVK